MLKSGSKCLLIFYLYNMYQRPKGTRDYYQTCLEAILKSSSKAKLFYLVHKMDLIAKDQLELNSY